MSESVPLPMFNTLCIFCKLSIHLREQIGAVKITTCHFSKVCDRSTFANVDGQFSNANVQQAHGGAAIVENLETCTQLFEVQVKFSYFHPTLSDPVYKPQYLNAIPNELN